VFSLDGFDKLLRTLQFLCRFLAFYISSSSSLVAIRKQFSLSRKLLKLGANVDSMRALAEVLKGDDTGVKRWTNIVKHFTLSIFGFLDGSLYFPDAGIFHIPMRPSVERWAHIFYGSALVASMINGLYRLVVIRASIVAAKQQQQQQQQQQQLAVLPSPSSIQDAKLQLQIAPPTPPATPPSTIRPTLAKVRKNVSFSDYPQQLSLEMSRIKIDTENMMSLTNQMSSPFVTPLPTPPDSPVDSPVQEENEEGLMHRIISSSFTTPLPSPPESVYDEEEDDFVLPIPPTLELELPSQNDRIQKLESERFEVAMSTLSAACDVIFPAAGLKIPIFTSLSEGVLGFAGSVSSLVGLRNSWKATKA